MGSLRRKQIRSKELKNGQIEAGQSQNAISYFHNLHFFFKIKKSPDIRGDDGLSNEDIENRDMNDHMHGCGGME